MTIYDLDNETRMRVTEMIQKVIGTKAECVNDKMTREERIKARFNYDKLFEKLAKIWVKNGDKALSMNYMDYGSFLKGVTPNGKRWQFDWNSWGWTERTHHCGTLWIEGQGCIFTSGTVARAFERIMEF